MIRPLILLFAALVSALPVPAMAERVRDLQHPLAGEAARRRRLRLGRGLGDAPAQEYVV